MEGFCLCYTVVNLFWFDLRAVCVACLFGLVCVMFAVFNLVLIVVFVRCCCLKFDVYLCFVQLFGLLFCGFGLLVELFGFVVLVCWIDVLVRVWFAVCQFLIWFVFEVGLFIVFLSLGLRRYFGLFWIYGLWFTCMIVLCLLLVCFFFVTQCWVWIAQSCGCYVGF